MPDRDPKSILSGFVQHAAYFVGIDSDGCAFDTMEVKHKECFIPNIVRYYELAAISRLVREVAEFVNLYSFWRGINRFPGLVMTMDLLAARPEVTRRSFAVPQLAGLRAWLLREPTLANSALRLECEKTNDPDLSLALEWSEAVNRSVSEIVRDVPPFPMVRECLEKLQGKADVMVVSATPGEALAREWREHELTPLVSLIAGQELGSKSEQIALSTGGRYDRDKILMVGDALGDLKAARASNALFFPIEPGEEDLSWMRLFEEGLPRFFSGTYAGAYMDEQIARFEQKLPKVPPWT
jgi:phosphoglycolate phosphatase-like HAD superfamily hydrolase